jgi:hypothetical protein
MHPKFEASRECVLARTCALCFSIRAVRAITVIRRSISFEKTSQRSVDGLSVDLVRRHVRALALDDAGARAFAR